VLLLLWGGNLGHTHAPAPVHAADASSATIVHTAFPLAASKWA